MSVLSTLRQPDKTELLASFTNGVIPDQGLYLQEIRVQKAWARGLEKIKMFSSSEADQVIAALDEATSLMEQGKFQWREEDEDIHMNLERFVDERTKSLGKRMHAGRSRNDLIATTLKLHVADSAAVTLELMDQLIQAMVELSEKNLDVIIPGMTHLQNGQPIRWSHALLGHAFAFKRDQKKFQAVKESALESMPLGSAALAGTTLAIDLTQISQELGFRSCTFNSYDAVGERDSLVDFLQASAHFGTHLSRLCEDIIYWSSAPVGLVQLSPDWSTGSSIMPNKRNPDVAELARGKSSLWLGQAMGVLSLMKGLPTSYASDLHETKTPYLKVCQDLALTLKVFVPFIESLTINREKALQLLNQGHILATEFANHLTDQGLPFREAYHLTAALVELAESKKVQVHELQLKDIGSVTNKISERFIQTLSFESTVEKRSFPGGTALHQLRQQLRKLKEKGPF